ncbi:MAG: hypothetical protein J0M12_02910 [Deltaproteobacteria bacterium]|nr:hypothetical protein [Deltaproteobacteria bacterium]
MRPIVRTAFILSLLLAPSYAGAQPAGKEDDRALIGGIHYEDSSPARNTYAETQDAAIDYFHKLAEVTSQLGQGATTGAVPAPRDNVIAYLNAAYLYCALNYGECPLVLNGILEADIINSRLAHQAQCPIMTSFWKAWVRSDMEARQKYQVKTGFLKVTADFNQQKRPAYIKCQETVQNEIAPKESDAIFFKSRYSADSSHALTAAKTAKLLEGIKVKVPNVFAAVGSGFGSAEPAKEEGRSIKVKR